MTTKFQAVLLLPTERQAPLDGKMIDPAGVQFDADFDYPIFREFSYGTDDMVGHGRIYRGEDGSLMVSGELSGPFAKYVQAKLAIGVSTIETVRHEEGMDILKSRVFAVSTTDRHADANQPSIGIPDKPS